MTAHQIFSSATQHPLKLVAVLWLFVLLCYPPSAEPKGALDDIRSSGVLLWGSDAEGGAPYVFPDPGNPSRLIGFEADLAEAIAQELRVKAKQFQVSWDTLLPALKRGDFHIAMNGIEWTAERAGAVAFSDPYYIFSQQLVVRKEETAIRSVTDLSGKTTATLKGTVAQSVLENLPGVQLKIYDGQVEPYRDLALGRVDAVFMDLPIALHYAKPDARLRFAGDPVGEGVYVIAVRTEDVDLLAEINRILDKLRRSGKLASIYRDWGIWDDRQIRLQQTDYKARAVYANPGGNGWGIYLPVLIKGALMTCAISVSAMLLAIALGLVLTLLRLAGGKVLKYFAIGYIEAIRGTPLLLQLYIVYYGLPSVGINLSAFTAAVLALGMNYAASEAEIYRAGLESIPKGQTEAALSLGMTTSMIYWRILIPQAVKVVLPPSTNDFISLFKDSSLVSVIAIVELTKSYNMLAVSSMRFLELGLLTAALYLIMSIPLAIFSNRLERRFHKI